MALGLSLDLLRPVLGVLRHLQEEIGVGGGGLGIDLVAVLVDQGVGQLTGDLDLGLVGLELDGADQFAGFAGVIGGGDLDGRALGLLQADVLLPGQQVEQLLDALGAVRGGVRCLSLSAIGKQAVVGDLVGEVPDGHLGGGDGLLLGQPLDAEVLGDVGDVSLRVAVLDGPGDLAADVVVGLELVVAGELLPGSDPKLGAPDGVHRDLNAVGEDALLVVGGVHREQLGRHGPRGTARRAREAGPEAKLALFRPRQLRVPRGEPVVGLSGGSATHAQSHCQQRHEERQDPPRSAPCCNCFH